MTPNAFGIDLLTQVMNASSVRHRVISQNIANVNNPHYQRREVAFEEELARVLETSGDGKLPTVTPRTVISDQPVRVDGNTVDIDREMGDLSKNALLYQAVAQIAASRLASLRSAISGR